MLTEQMETFIFVFQCYAEKYNMQNAAELLRKWDETGITQEVYDVCARHYQTDDEAMTAIEAILER